MSGSMEKYVHLNYLNNLAFMCLSHIFKMRRNYLSTSYWCHKYLLSEQTK